MPRDYTSLSADLDARLDPDSSRPDRMRLVIDACWEHLSRTGVSWIGFYTREAGANEMLLGPRRDKPACSPIGLHGACGQACTQKTTLVVTHVRNLGAGYVACDPRDTSELVIPCIDADGSCWGVLDADSFDEGSFTEADAAALGGILERAGLTMHAHRIPVRVV